MSRAFVKEDSGEQPEQLPERPISPHPNYMTRNGYQQMSHQLAALELEQRALNGDRTLEAQTRLAAIQRDLSYIRNRVASAIVVEAVTEAPPSTIFGSLVCFVDQHDNEHQYRIVGEDEADISQKRISWTSPLARALLGKHVGDLALWHKPQSSEEIEILSIQP